MISVNNEKISTKHFPDNTQFFKLDTGFVQEIPNLFTITWAYENEEECMTLWYAVNHLRDKKKNAIINLYVLYFPNARMDRTKANDEVFTLKYFAKFINELNLNNVYILDPHSNVTPALINNVTILPWEDYVKRVMEYLEFNVNLNQEHSNDGCVKMIERLVIYFPDNGAMKRYCDTNLFGNREVLYGIKNRDWATGKILGLTINDRNGYELKSDKKNVKVLEGKTVLMVDDIISYGGTFSISADKLKELGAKEIYAYATHCEKSVLDADKSILLERLQNGTVKKIFTTNSLFNIESEFVQTI